jgi:hypothetical protein
VLNELKKQVELQGYEVVDGTPAEGQVVLKESDEGVISAEALGGEIDTLRAIFLLLGYTSIPRKKKDELIQLILKSMTE